VAARALPVVPRLGPDEDVWHSDTPWDPRVVAYVRRGPYGLVLTVLAELHARGGVDARRTQELRQLDPPADGDYDDPLSVAIYLATRWCRWPGVIAWLPSVRRAARPYRADAARRGLVTPVRRQLLSLTLLLYGVSLAVAGAADVPQGSTVVGAFGVAGVAALLATGPRRTVAGHRFLRAERRLLTAWIGEQDTTDRVTVAAMLLATVSLDGLAALELLCQEYPLAGILAPRRVRRPAPRLVPYLVPTPATAPDRVLEPILIRIPAPAARHRDKIAA
jgi:uncharacterized protein (TIGR04222 family)